MEKVRRFTVELGPDLHRRLKAQCALADTPLTEAVRMLVEREVESPSLLVVKSKPKARQKAEAA